MMIIWVEGIDRLEAKLTAIPEETRAAATAELRTCLANLQEISTELAPILHGWLRGSADSDAQLFGTMVEGFVSFDTDYATRQHEEMSYNHPRGGQAKYLLQPLEENIDSYIDAIGGAIAEAVDK